MSATTPIDLQDLAIRRDRGNEPSIAPKRRLVARIVLPAVLIVGFASVLAWAARDVYLPRTAVTVVPVQVSRTAAPTGGTPLFNAAGWLEPRPTAIHVAALAPGVVEELLVVEDQPVVAGEPIARLVDDDARLALEQAEALLELRQSEIREAEAAQAAAQVNFDTPAHLELPVAEAEAALAAIETELSNLPHLLTRAEARLELAEFNWESSAKLSTGQAIAQVQVEQARAEYAAAKAEVAELTKRKPALQSQQTALRRRVAAAGRRLDLKTDERQALEEARARILGARSRQRQAQVALQEAQLRLERMVIPAPVDGRILNLVALPGSQLSVGNGAMEGGDRSTVVKMYQPDRLQVRVDVRFEDLPKVGRGQTVEIRSPAIAEPLTGEVLFLTGFANIQKNTLEVKVLLDDPPDVLKPEMLVDVTFLAPDNDAASDGDDDALRVLVPRSLVHREGDTAYVWVANVAQQIARRRPVALGAAPSPDIVEVTDGLTAASRLIAAGHEQLRDGDRIRITGEAAETTSALSSSIPDERSRTSTTEVP
jgi:HlyD family secretion protein